ncbi:MULTISPECIES: hypothetical protein [Brucella/Ochrobactrum group]|uniref:Uncharacterized protein n=1 Tax=Brucella pituitosa TaxID=571256 RepID=A0A643ETU6_9HYPH|nr:MULTISPECIES: hypothetical protein [Brucella/Ochrobactrum group]KAB0565889.1 hypothetical protein F7Q93_22790 [Brucella pituitosa]MCQ9147598.1 hypothetical protein [Ochrobactrum sp. BTU2]
MADREKKERFGVFGRYVRWRAQSYQDVGRGARQGYKAAKDGLGAFRTYPKPEEGGFSFQDDDGGYRRFWHLVGDLGEEDIQAAIYKWDRENSIFLGSAAVCLALIPTLYFFYTLSLTGIFSLILLSCAFFLLAVRASYRGWQIRQRRMGSMRGFLFGKNRGSTEIRKVTDD